jgi:hypothetical protein
MRYPMVWTLGIALVVAAAPVEAQEQAPARPRTEELRRRVRERVAERIQQELDLTDDQVRRLRATVGTYGGRRRELESRQRAIRQTLARQLRPGESTSPDSVARMTDELMALRVRYAESFREEQAELARYLDPVQRARVTLLRERLANRARDFEGRRSYRERRMER